MQSGILLPEQPVEDDHSAIVVRYKGRHSAEFEVAFEGKVSPMQKFVLAGWLAHPDAEKGWADEEEAAKSEQSEMVFTFEGFGKSEFTLRVVGGVTLNQMLAAAHWMDWSARLDFTQGVAMQAAAAQQDFVQRQQVANMLGRGRSH